MDAKEIIEKMRKEDRLLKESAVVKAVQKELIEMGYEPFEEKVMGVYTAIENVSQICTVGEFQDLKETQCKYWNAEHEDCALNYAEIRNKSIDEFAERLKEKAERESIGTHFPDGLYGEVVEVGELKNMIEKIAEEMRGAEC